MTNLNDFSNIDLREMREKAGLTQAQVAAFLGCSQSQVSRYEDDPDDVPMKIIRGWFKACGVGLTGDAIEPDAPYTSLYKNLSNLVIYLKEWKGTIPTFQGAELSTPNKLAKTVKSLSRAPKLVMTGRFDCGKSRLLNILLGANEDVLPSSYSPTTRIITVLRHIDERPDWLGDAQVALFKEGVDFDCLDDVEHINQYYLEKGGLDLVRLFGTHSDNDDEDSFKPTAANADSCVIYYDAPLLRAAIAIDSPGFGSGERFDEYKAGRCADLAEMLVFMAPATGYMNETDILYLTPLLRHRPLHMEGIQDSNNGLADLLLVASHARQDSDDLDLILTEGSVRLSRHLREAEISGVDPEALRARSVPWLAEDPESRKAFKETLMQSLNGRLVKTHKRTIALRIAKLKADALNVCASQIAHLREFQAKTDDTVARIKQLENQEQARQQFVAKGRDNLCNEVYRAHESCKEEILEVFEQWLDPDHIAALLSKHFNDDERKEAEQRGVSLVLNKLQGQIEDVITTRRREMVKQVNQFLQGYELEFFTASDPVVGLSVPLFDVSFAFQTALAGSSVLLGLGAFVGMFSIAPMLAVVMVVAGILGLVQGFRQDWRTSLAKKMVKRIKNARVEKFFLKSNKSFWKSIGESVETGFDGMEQQYFSFRDQLQSLIEGDPSTVRQRIETEINEIQSLCDFIHAAPWAALEGDAHG